ncbi:enoyl-CoA hydratase/isomerase family protein [Bacillus sp. FJAT-27986]|uniref:enoyl-CoA hydratase/isomerase family protein n=1 Tax=Bacillus sp. FJAT-27986 TaxID=1743146 RepID=UPI00080ADA86|nr:enoyl-CoA hydratase [Bacillus sp. FJAT-27986]OCA86650.1 enoyl-CoA hydratase [Bacillus sp. FJAT-27986]
MYSLLRVEKENNVATVVINNPPMNVLSELLASELCDAFTELRDDNSVVTVILTGEGDRAFMAGADIKEFPNMINQSTEAKVQPSKKNEVFQLISDFPKPTIAYLNGITLGGGFELALVCDLRIAKETAQLGLPEVKLGLFPGGGGTQRLPRLIGSAKAKELMFTGDSITAEEALKLGIINQIATEEEEIEAARKLARKISRHSLQALRRIKQAVNEGTDGHLQDGLELESNLFQEIFTTEDMKEGVTAFLEKRRPVFTHQ